MKIDVKFEETRTDLAVNFGETQMVNDGGYEKGYADGLSARRHEVWTITYVDGTVEEKEVALL